MYVEMLTKTTWGETVNEVKHSFGPRLQVNKKSGNSVNKTGVKKDYEGFEVEKVEFWMWKLEVCQGSWGKMVHFSDLYVQK